MSRAFGPRRSTWAEVTEPDPGILDGQTLEQLAFLDLAYRSLCAILFNFAQSGHPGGSVSSGRIVEGLLFDCMDYSIGDPNRRDADILSYAAGHKALGLYSIYALRDEIIRITDPGALPDAANLRLRLEDLLGFRRNPTTGTPLFKRFGAKALDGHPTPATPFVRLSTGASGVGMGSSLGLAVAALDYYGKDAPRVHIIEGEGGLTPGRVYFYRVKSTANGKTSYSQIFTFTTAPADTGLTVESIGATQTFATPDDTYTNGFAWTFNVTVNNPAETNVALKFAQWASGANLLNAGGNMEYSTDNSTCTGGDTATCKNITTNATYGPNINVSSIDLDSTRGGRQIKLYVKMKVPAATPGGSYSSSYGVQSL